MTESEWTLKKQNIVLRKALAQAQANLCQHEFNAAQADDAALGEKWVDESAVQPLKVVGEAG